MKRDTKSLVEDVNRFLGSVDEILLAIRADHAIEVAAKGYECDGYIGTVPCGCRVKQIEEDHIFKTGNQATVNPLRPADLEAMRYSANALGDYIPFKSGAISGWTGLYASQILAMNKIPMECSEEEFRDAISEYTQSWERRMRFWNKIHNPLPPEEGLLDE